MASHPKRISANSKFLAPEVWLEVRGALTRMQLVTHWVLQPLSPRDRVEAIEFEIRVTRLGDCQLPRSQKLLNRILKEAGK